MKGHYYKRNCTCNTENCGCKWTFVIDLGKDFITGKRRQKSKSGFATKQDAEYAAAEFLNKAMHTEDDKQKKDLLFEDFANDWLTHYVNYKVPKPGTIRLRQYSIDKLVRYFSNLKLKDITKEQYQKVLNDLKNQNYALNTISGFHATAKMIFKYATDERFIEINPTNNTYIVPDEEVIIEDDDEELPKYLEKDELALFLNTTRKYGLYMDYLIFLIISYTGIRVGELVALKWRNIDFRKKAISITKTYYNPDNNTEKYILVPPKTKKSRRKIVVDDEIMDLLIKHKAEQDKLIKKFGKSYTNGDFIFANFNSHPGYPILIKLVETRMARLLKKTELNSNITPHSLRHTHTSLLAEAGVGLEEIMDRLGHQDDDVTRKVYLHVTTDMKTEAADKFSKLMKKTCLKY